MLVHGKIICQLELLVLVIIGRSLVGAVEVMSRYWLSIRARLGRLLPRVTRQLEVDILVLNHLEELNGL